MNKLFSLIKVDLIHSYSINKLSKKHNKERKLGSLVATIILGTILFISIFTVMFSMGLMAKEFNQLDYLLVFGYTIGSFLTFTMTISKANGFLFEAKDFELLMSMPIKTKTIVLSKLISLLTICYLGFGAIFIPCLVVYGLFSNSGIIFYLLSIISLITGPLLIVTICSFISYFLGIALRKFKHKSIFMSIFSLLIFTVVFILYMTLHQLSLFVLVVFTIFTTNFCVQKIVSPITNVTRPTPPPRATDTDIHHTSGCQE